MPRYIHLRSALALTLAATAVGAATARSANADESGTGTPTTTVTVMAFPKDSTLRRQKIGEQMLMYAVDAAVDESSTEGVGVTVDPASVPAAALNENGVVNFEIQILSSDGSVSMGAFSLLRDPTDSSQWLEVDDSVAASQAASAMRSGKRDARATRVMAKVQRLGFTQKAVQVVTGRAVGSARSDETDGQDWAGTGRWNQLIKNSGAPDDGSDNVAARGGAASCELMDNDNASTTVATSYPVGGDLSWLTYSNSENTTTGVAVTFGGSTFHKDGTKNTSDSWGQDFAASANNRSYRISVNYGLYSCVNVVTNYRWHKVAPRYQTGGTGTHFIDAADRPDWNNCDNVAKGNWWRGREDGGNYSLGYGVKIAEAIGFNLYSEHGYSSGTRLYFGVTKTNKKMCGNDNVPARASKLIERVR
jgi:hypothetical protein